MLFKLIWSRDRPASAIGPLSPWIRPSLARDALVQDDHVPDRAPPAVRLADRVPCGRDAVRTVPARARRLLPPLRADHQGAPPGRPREILDGLGGQLPHLPLRGAGAVDGRFDLRA